MDAGILLENTIEMRSLSIQNNTCIERLGIWNGIQTEMEYKRSSDRLRGEKKVASRSRAGEAQLNSGPTLGGS